MSGIFISMPVRQRAHVAPQRVQMDFGTLLGKIERTLRWLDRHGIAVAAFACSTLKGARVHVDDGGGRVRKVLAEEAVSRGHSVHGGSRFEDWEARDPATGVLIVWQEQHREGEPCDR